MLSDVPLEYSVLTNSPIFQHFNIFWKTITAVVKALVQDNHRRLIFLWQIQPFRYISVMMSECYFWLSLHFIISRGVRPVKCLKLRLKLHSCHSRTPPQSAVSAHDFDCWAYTMLGLFCIYSNTPYNLFPYVF